MNRPYEYTRNVWPGHISKCRKAFENTFDNGMSALYNAVDEFNERIGCEVGLVSYL